MPSDTGKRLPVDFAGGAAGILLRPMVARASAADYDQQASTATDDGACPLADQQLCEAAAALPRSRHGIPGSFFPSQTHPFYARQPLPGPMFPSPLRSRQYPVTWARPHFRRERLVRRNSTKSRQRKDSLVRRRSGRRQATRRTPAWHLALSSPALKQACEAANRSELSTKTSVRQIQSTMKNESLPLFNTFSWPLPISLPCSASC